MTNFSICNAKLRGVVQYGMNVESRRLGLAGKLTHPLYELFLKVIGEIVLGAEKDDAALRD